MLPRSSRISARNTHGASTQSNYYRVSTREPSSLPDELYRQSRNNSIARASEQHRLQRPRRNRPDEDENARRADDGDPEAPPASSEKPLSLIDRVRLEKNRAVQRWLVALRLVEPSHDLIFTQKKRDFADGIDALRRTRRTIQRLTAQVLEFTSAVSSFASNSSLYSQIAIQSMSHQDFQHFTHLVDARARAFSDEVARQIVDEIDARITLLTKTHAMIVERAALQLDVDYAKRKLTVAQHKGGQNLVAERKYSLQFAQKRCDDATRTITHQLTLVSSEQQPEIEKLLARFSQLLLDFFQFGDELLAPSALKQVPILALAAPPPGAFPSELEPEPEPVPSSPSFASTIE